jgi:hypothetical protein
VWLDHLLIGRPTHLVVERESESKLDRSTQGRSRISVDFQTIDLVGWVNGLLAQVVRAHP